MLKPRCACSLLFKSLLSRRHIRYSSSETKPFYITTPIFYVNAKPHIGHLYTEVLSDVLRRHQLFAGQQATLLTGTDEHGMKVAQAAQVANKSPKEFCDSAAEVFKDLPGRANVHYDRFIRTTDADHKLAVEAFWRKLEERGYIYKGSHSGWYSISDETFYPESSIKRNVHPETGEEVVTSQETGSLVKWTKEENYHFRLSSMKQALLDLYKSKPDFILPQIRYDDIIRSVEAGLSDLSISRPSERLTWGLPVPGDSSQTIYVWLDALVNYITAAGYPDLASMESQRLWPADLQVIGKDIMRFHCIYWPAFLLAAELPVQRQVLSHAHWTVDNMKMSKSIGNVVDPWEAISHYGVDAVRYYLMRDGRLENDGSYSSSNVILRYNTELVGGVGNLVQRITSTAFAELAAMPRPVPATCSPKVAEFAQAVDTYAASYADNMGKQFLIHKALQDIVDLVYKCNTFFQHSAPWFKDIPLEERRAALYAGQEGARVAALLLQAIVPDAACALLDRLGVKADKRTLPFAKFGTDDTYSPVASRDRMFTLLVDSEKVVDNADTKAIKNGIK
ncbi:tRNA synthetases class I (M)-domain-containing protein [Protomyces lactucae-debilis]|uniref:Probable methionine--tRNA ligase, mitochondrial n=1 Tax=Protomyces lactucae-debilis TaxID=2754530 RepID=A0A1Y2FY40_PROLT|nr:tRNA synthetases class I (M)-domain-containing protein [Protomyces lactucae-debilis]ORY87585.1 tRNA synthetases class I (M)-domain-containing protein [Protomyces lactucae-debilis]